MREGLPKSLVVTFQKKRKKSVMPLKTIRFKNFDGETIDAREIHGCYLISWCAFENVFPLPFTCEWGRPTFGRNQRIFSKEICMEDLLREKTPSQRAYMHSREHIRNRRSKCGTCNYVFYYTMLKIWTTRRQKLQDLLSIHTCMHAQKSFRTLIYQIS